MSTLTEDPARSCMHKLLAAMSQAGGPDLFIANDFPPSMNKRELEDQELARKKLERERSVTA